MSKYTKRQAKWILFSNMHLIVLFVTAVCVLFLIKLRWPKKKSIYGTKTVFKPAKRYDGNPRPFYIGVPGGEF